jgi:hypothetical protein
MPAELDSTPPDPKPRLWSKVLLFVGSAAFGGLAVALWNRRELIQMQNERSNPTPPPYTPAAQMEEEIF